MELTEMNEAQLWRGRSLGQLSQDEKREVFRRAAKKLSTEFARPEVKDAVNRALLNKKGN